jgi:hypothetical protein
MLRGWPMEVTMTYPTSRVILIPAFAFALACSSDAGDPLGPDVLNDHTPNACDHDATAPVISSVGVSPATLWPPNHKFVPVTVTLQVTDNCSTVTGRIVGVASDEPENGLGDGNTAPDWIVTGPLGVLLRSERSGLGDGRTYTITVEASDVAGNTSVSSTTVFVPHDQGTDND